MTTPPIVDAEFKALIPPLTPEEYAGLEAGIIKFGRALIDLVIWNGILLDGHNRLEICIRLDLPYECKELRPAPVDRTDAKIWIITNQLSRRNLSVYNKAHLGSILEPLLREKANINIDARGHAAKSNLVQYRRSENSPNVGTTETNTTPSLDIALDSFRYCRRSENSPNVGTTETNTTPSLDIALDRPRPATPFARVQEALRQEDGLKREAVTINQNAAKPTASSIPTPPVRPSTPATPRPVIKPIDVREEVAKAAGVSSNTISRVKLIDEKASPEIKAKLISGSMSVNEAYTKINQGAKKEARAGKEVALAKATAKANQALVDANKVYNVIYADPEWRFEPYSRETGMDRAADNHYPTSELAKIKARKVPAAKDCVLFLWATVPMLPQALAVMEAWGFTYKSNYVWVKDKIGTGYWGRNKHEHLLIGTKGNIPAPAQGDQPASAIEAPVGHHSEKPEDFAKIIEKLYPTVPKLEMNARGPRQGWDVWGNEAEEAS